MFVENKRFFFLRQQIQGHKILFVVAFNVSTSGIAVASYEMFVTNEMYLFVIDTSSRRSDNKMFSCEHIKRYVDL